MWLDTRGARYSRELIGGPLMGYSPRALATWIRHTGVVPSPFGGDPVSHMLHLERECPDVLARARWLLEPVDYLSMRFTGRAAASHASMSGAWLTDNRRLDLLAYDAVLVGLAGVDAAKLPPLVETGSMVGTVKPEVAAELGSRPRAPRWSPACPDLHSARLGAGAIELEGEPHLSIGTTAWITLPAAAQEDRRDASDRHRAGADRRQLPRGQQPGDRRPLPAVAARRRSRSKPGESFGDLVALAETPAGRRTGCSSRPGWRGSAARSTTAPRGGFHNVSVGPPAADLARAVLEGVAYNTRWLLEAAEHFARHRLDPIRLVGGGAQSDLWCQILADVTDHVVERLAEPLLANLRGAALFAGLALGEVTGPPTSVHWCLSTAPSAPTPPSDAPTTGCSTSSPGCTGPNAACSGGSAAGLSPGSRALGTAERCAVERRERAGQEHCGAQYHRLKDVRDRACR